MVFRDVLFPTFGFIPAFNDHLARSLFQEDRSGGLCFTGYRYYAVSQLEIEMKIKTLIFLGFSLEEISMLLEAESKEEPIPKLPLISLLLLRLQLPNMIFL